MVVHRNIQLSAFSSIHGNSSLQLFSLVDILCCFDIFSILGFGMEDLVVRRIFTLASVCALRSIPTCCVRCDAAWVQDCHSLLLYLFIFEGADCAI